MSLAMFQLYLLEDLLQKIALPSEIYFFLASSKDCPNPNPNLNASRCRHLDVAQCKLGTDDVPSLLCCPGTLSQNLVCRRKQAKNRKDTIIRVHVFPKDDRRASIQAI